jgi:hypothetical protein
MTQPDIPDCGAFKAEDRDAADIIFEPAFATAGWPSAFVVEL